MVESIRDLVVQAAQKQKLSRQESPNLWLD
jgi:hypothetical protein